MPIKVFATGATGFIGGDALVALYTAHPDWSYTLLARNSSKAATLKAAFPSAHTIEGDLSAASAALLTSEAYKADIILHFASADIVPGAAALVAGARQHSVESPAYLIHTSGAGILLYEDTDRNSYGERGEQVWDDVGDIKKLVNEIPDHALHREVDKIILGASTGMKGADHYAVKTAIVCPPLVYGRGRGPVNQRSIQMPNLARCMMQRGEGFVVGKGEVVWTGVHVRDLSKAYVLLAEAAATELGSGQSEASWNEEGYYFAESGEFLFGDMTRRMIRRGFEMGLMKGDQCKSLGVEEVRKMYGFGPGLWGTNARTRATRLRQLGWKPEAPSLESTIDEVLLEESESLEREDTVGISLQEPSD